MSVYVIGTDRGFAKFGYSIFELTPTGERVVEVHVIETKKDSKKKEVLAASDNHRRGQQIYGELSSVFNDYKLWAAAAESTSLPRNSSSAHKIGIADGIWLALLAMHNIPLAEASPQAIKVKLCGKATASKAYVEGALERRYPGQFDKFKVGYPKGKWEHGFDAAASIVACLDSDVFKMARQFVGR
jgi:Holliday junction resolvasome RuvABC endonuclease subunit